MNRRYEVVSSPHEPALKLILLEGTWESLPFEIRLWCPWRGATLCADSALTSLQRGEVTKRGYSIGHATFLGELISNQSGASIANAGSTRPMTPIVDLGSTRRMLPIKVQGLASASVLKRMQRSIQELAKTIEQSMGLIAETQLALGAESTWLPRLADAGISKGALYDTSAPQGTPKASKNLSATPVWKIDAAIRDSQSAAHLLRGKACRTQRAAG
jgi:hypothetical protein